ncbi:MAG TPA: GNAT family N-acetyltransferase [Kofleriaceae bacterium]|nr:GNAT family N-acetyltransferase [Kofleriaceae bacterium]
MTPAGLTVRAIDDDEVDRFRANLMGVFGYDPEADPHGSERFRALVDLRRTYCAFDGADLVATAAAFELGLSVPGGLVAMGGLTMVTVRPTHRRRGILRALIARHLDDVRGRGEPVSGLWASEGSIYGRFGYGVAAESDVLAIAPRPGFAHGRPVDEVAQLDDAEAADVLPRVYAAALRVRPGMFTRSAAWWRHRRFADRPDVRNGRSPRTHVVCRRGGEATGYVVLRQKLAFEPGGMAAGTLDVEELVALDGTAEATLWRYVHEVDLFPKVACWNAPVDALAPWLASDRRSITRARRADTLWLRLCDVGAALAARAYAADGALRLEVVDPFGANGPGASTVALVVEGGVARCEPATGAADLSLELSALGSVYLGGVAPSVLARAGLIRGAAAAVARADRMFAWPVAPWCAEVF